MNRPQCRFCDCSVIASYLLGVEGLFNEMLDEPGEQLIGILA